MNTILFLVASILDFESDRDGESNVFDPLGADEVIFEFLGARMQEAIRSELSEVVVFLVNLTLRLMLGCSGAFVFSNANAAPNPSQSMENVRISPRTNELNERTNPLSLDHGIVARLQQIQPPIDAVLAFCAATKDLQGEQYENLVETLHVELLRSINQESGSVRGIFPYFLQEAERREKFFQCLENGATNVSADTYFRLYQIEVDNGRSINTDIWLIKAIERGHLLARYVLANEVSFHQTKPDEASTALQAYINPDKYFEFLLPVAESGNRLAQLDLAYFYLGRGRSPIWRNHRFLNPQNALRLLETVATQTSDLEKRYQASEMLGSLYLAGTLWEEGSPGWQAYYQRRRSDRKASEGLPIEKDYAQAFYWYRQIPENRLGNYCSAAQGLAKISGQGLGREVDIAMADRYRQIVSDWCVKR